MSDTKLHSFGNPQGVKKELSFEEHESIIRERLGGIPYRVTRDTNKPNAFYWMKKHTEVPYINVANGKVGTLAHELRHAWQYLSREAEGFSFVDDSEDSLVRRFANETVKAFGYFSSDKEEDANTWALNYCKEHGLDSEVNRITDNINTSRFTATALRLGIPPKSTKNRKERS